MSSLFNISEELKNIYATIEDNGGELTEEVEEALAISEENLKDKLLDYSNLIKQLKGDVAAIELEDKRLKELKDHKSKLIDKLSSAVAEAVYAFGDTTKSGGKFIDLGTEKISVRVNNKCEINEDLIDFASKQLQDIIIRLKENGLLGETPFEERYLELLGNGFDRNDIANIDCSINFTGNLLDLCNGNRNELLKLLSKIENNGVKLSASKAKCKSVIAEGNALSFANIEPSKSITIK